MGRPATAGRKRKQAGTSRPVRVTFERALGASGSLHAEALELHGDDLVVDGAVPLAVGVGPAGEHRVALADIGREGELGVAVGGRSAVGVLDGCGAVAGDIDVKAASRRVSIETVSGDLEFSGDTSRISAETVSGDMNLSGIAGEIEATTVSGDMELQAGLVDSVKLETVSGDVTTVAEVSGNGKLSAESMSGDVTILLPASQDGLFRAQSFSGRISTDFGSVEQARHGPGSHLKYLAGSNGAEVRVESFSGNIRLKHD